jgi:transcriptional regulator with XRE-family HTH domain
MAIKEIRLQKGWSQEKLSEITGLSLRTIQRIEKDNKVSEKSLELLAKAFEIDSSKLKELIATKQSKDSAQKINIDSELALFAIINLILFLINIISNSKHLWFIYPLLGWGIPLFYRKYFSAKKRNLGSELNF